MKKRTHPNSSMDSDLQSFSKKVHMDDNSTCESLVSEQINSVDSYIKDQKFLNLLYKKGVKKLFPIQCATFNIIYQGKDIMARDRTGSGKTLAFGLPIIQRLRHKKWESKLPKFLIIQPTRQLTIQVENQLSSLKLMSNEFKSLAAYGKSSLSDNIQKLKSGVDIVVATPGRLNDLIQRKSLNLQDLQVICLDQADQILKQGFKDQIQKVFVHLKSVNKKKVQTLMFSATVPEWLNELSKKYQTQDTPYINLIKNQDIRTSKTIEHLAVDSTNLDISQQAELIQALIQKNGGISKRVIIFCQRKKDVDLLSKELKVKNQPLHGDIPQVKRQKTYKFFKQGFLNCIVATNVAARGLDFPSIDLIIQMEPPGNAQDYIHRAGRTGRAGNKGVCITLFQRKKKHLISKIQQEAKIQIKKIEVEFNKGKSNDKNDQTNEKPKYNSRQSDSSFKKGNDFKEKFPSNSFKGNYNKEEKPQYEKRSQHQNKYEKDSSYQNKYEKGDSNRKYESKNDGAPYKKDNYSKQKRESSNDKYSNY